MLHKLVFLTIFNPTAIMTCLVPEFSEEWILFGFQTILPDRFSSRSITKKNNILGDFFFLSPSFPCQ